MHGGLLSTNMEFLFRLSVHYCLLLFLQKHNKIQIVKVLVGSQKKMTYSYEKRQNHDIYSLKLPLLKQFICKTKGVYITGVL